MVINNKVLTAKVDIGAKVNVMSLWELNKIRTTEDVVAQIGNGMVFSVLASKSSFWQIPLDRASSAPMTFATPFGHYRFVRMPFGINSASEVFQRAMEQVLAEYPLLTISYSTVAI